MSVLAAGACAQAPLPLEPRAPATRIPPAPAASDEQELTPDLFYRIMLGEVALQRGDIALAARSYYMAAQKAQDPQLAKRATEIALTGRLAGLATESARLWSTL